MDAHAVAEHSLWLLPCADDAVWLTAMIDDLAPRFGTPPFIAHVTLQGDSVLSCEALSTLARSLAQTIPVQRWPIADVASSAHYFRMLYLAFAANDDFARLQQGTVAVTQTRVGLSPFPHLSLAYGNDSDRAAARARELGAPLHGRTLTFDRLAVARSSCTLPIADWRIAASFALCPLSPSAVE